MDDFPDRFPEFEPVYIAEADAFVVRLSDGWLVVVNESTHLGEPLNVCPVDGHFLEPHGARWDFEGRYLWGPADRALDRYPTRVVDGMLEINTRDVLLGPPEDRSMPRPAAVGCM